MNSTIDLSKLRELYPDKFAESERIAAHSRVEKKVKERAEKFDKDTWRQYAPEGQSVLVAFPLGPCASGCGKDMNPASYAVKVQGRFYKTGCVQWIERCVCGAVETPEPDGRPVAKGTLLPCLSCWPLYHALSFAFRGLQDFFSPQSPPKGFFR